MQLGMNMYALGNTGNLGIGAGQTATASQPTTGEIQLATKKVVTLVAMQNELLRYQSDLAFQTVQDDALRALAAAEDKAFLVGEGTDGAPKGLLHWAASANKFNMTGGDTTALRRKDLVKGAGLPRRANVPVIDPVVFMNGRTYYDLWAAVDANSNPAFERYLLAGVLFGYKIVITENVPTVTAGSYVIFADMGQAVIGQGVNAEVEFIPNATYHNGATLVSGASNDTSVIRVVTEVDFMLRYASAASVISQVTWGA
jgi:HK97 family phage major capsid protein